ncbi:hypothetical protein B0H19DRAFT_1200727 [Mycena capillaripes]|nr:hypothetical protein B0H19DRAFT_1200727 [Mycena capillaripes]
MPKADTTEKKRRREKRKEEETQRLREEVERTQCVSTGQFPSASSPHLFDVSTITFTEEDVDHPACDGLSTHGSLVSEALPAKPPRDLSALRNDSAHPWRNIRRRNHRVLPQRNAHRPFPRSLPKNTPGILLPLPANIHLVSIDPIHPPEIPFLAMPPPLKPFATTFGPVNSSLALGCAREVDYEQGLARLGRISELAWAPPLADSQQHFRDLPPDQLVFISTLLEIMVLVPVFQPFFESAVMGFVHDWVEYREGQFG